MNVTEVPAILADPSIRRWVREQYQAALGRDPVDALADAELLVELLRGRLEEQGAAVAGLDAGL